jgi:hypothetical protein
MNTDLTNSTILPIQQPYNTEPWSYNGNENLETIPSNLVDWVLVELRDTSGSALEANGNSIACRKAGLLLSDGTISNMDGNSPLEFPVSIRENLYVVVYHRNHLPVMSSEALQQTEGVFMYDFTDGGSKALGGALAQKELAPAVYGMIAGDAEASGLIDENDINSYWELQAGENGYKQADFNLNKQVDNTDKNKYWFPNKGSSEQVPD